MAPKRKAQPAKAAKDAPSGNEDAADGGAVAANQDLYSVLGVDRSASQEEIRKAYHRMALRLHPDKNRDDKTAKEKFQTLQHVFSILGDADKRRLYDETGCTDDDAVLSGENISNLYEYYRSVFKEVTVEAVEQFEEDYRGSEEEAKDLKELYTRFKGRMDVLFEFMICSRPEVDSHRFKDVLENAIKQGELKSYKPFKTWAAEVAKSPPPSTDPLAKTNKKRKKSKDSGSESSLVAIIRGRQKAGADSLVAALEAKYAGGKKTKAGGGRRGGKILSEPSEEEFAAAQQRLLKKKRGGT